MSALSLVTRGIKAVVPAMSDLDREMSTRHHAYQDPNSSMTLAEGLEEYYAMGELYKARLGVRAQRWFRAHDVTHVVFGCSTTPEQESVVDAWTMFGTTWKWEEYLGEVRYPDQRERILEEITGGIGQKRAMFLIVTTVPYVLEVRRRAQRMHQRWHFYGHEPYHQYSLADLRREFNIELLCS